MDEYAQETPSYEAVSVAEKVTKRGGKGDRAGQMRRYRARKPTKYRNYMRNYMRVRRAKARVLTDDV